MIYIGDRCPNVGAVAVLANIRRLNVKRILAGRIGAIVTTDAVIHDIEVIEVSR